MRAALGESEADGEGFAVEFVGAIVPAKGAKR